MMRRTRLSLSVALAAALMAMAAAVRAAEGMPAVEIVGVAPLPGQGVDRDQLPYGLQTASGKALQERGGNLADFLDRAFTGVNVNDISGSPFQVDVTYRGYRASPVLGTSQGLSVYLDGVRVNEAFGDVVNWDMLPEAAIGGVQLAPAANPLYGLNTLGGALVLNTRSGNTHPGFSGAIAGSSHGQRRADLAYGIGNQALPGAMHAFAAATLFRDRGWRDQSAGRLGNLFVKVGGMRGALDWQLALLGGDSRLVGNGLLPDSLYAGDRRAVYTYPDETRNRLRQIQFSAGWPLLGDGRLTASAYLRNSRRDTVNGDVADDYADYVADCGPGFDGAGAALAVGCGKSRAEGAALHPASLNTTSTRQRSRGLGIGYRSGGAGVQWLAGASMDRSRVGFAQYEQAGWFTPGRGVQGDGEEEREEEVTVAGTARHGAVYGAATWAPWPGTWVTAAARYNHARVSNALATEGEAQPRERFGYTRLNPSLGVAVRIAPAWTVVANLAQNNRVPTVIELGCADPEQPCRLPVGLQADPYLKQVVSRTAEAGMRWRRHDRSGMAVTVYRTVNHDDILFRAARLAQHGYFSNFGRTLHAGADVTADVRAGAMSARVAYSFLHAVYDAPGRLFAGTRTVDVTPGMRLPGLPRHALKLDLDWRAGAALKVGAAMTALSPLVAQGNEDGLLTDDGERADLRIRGRALLSLHATWEAAAWAWYARVNNVTDRRYESFGAVAADLFAGGRLLQPHERAGGAEQARFVAPGAPRSLTAGLRLRF